MPVLSASRRVTTLAPPLPITNTVMQRAGLVLRRGQFSLLAAAPGVGKTVFATNLSVFTQVPTIYFSADSDEWTVRMRASAILSGVALDTIEQQLNEPAWEAHYTGLLHRADHIDWCFRSDIDVLDFIWPRIDAHAELRGDYPQLIVVDNLGNTVGDSDNEYAELRQICRDLQVIARGTQAHVLALHHVKGGLEGGTKPIGMGDLLGNIGKIPEVVLGLNRSGENQVNLTVPKNRGGKSGMSLPLTMHYPTATVGGYTR